jgi:hypothetical protein
VVGGTRYRSNEFMESLWREIRVRVNRREGRVRDSRRGKEE